MFQPGKDKMAFIIGSVNYCYDVMSFKLKNVGVIYQRLMDKIFCEQIGKNMEVYANDMVSKFNSMMVHVQDLQEIFYQIKRYHMHLNLRFSCYSTGELKLI